MPQTNRIIALDFLRGLMLLVMMLDHLQYFPFNSLLPVAYPYTFQTLGFVNAAEGFFFLSGLVFALVYTPRYLSGGQAAFDRLAWRRAFYIYAYHIATFAIIALLFAWSWFAANWPQNWESQEMIKAAPLAMFLRALIFTHQTGLLDILPLYVIFVLIAPLIMRLLVADKAWITVLLCIALWVGGQFRPQLYLESLGNFHLGWFEAAAWQLMFFGGFWIGYLMRTRKGFSIPIRAHWIFIALGICLWLFYLRHFAPPAAESAHYPFFDSRPLGAVRVINMAALSYLIYALCHWRPRWFTAHYFTALGQHSIQVFAYHIVLCYVLRLWKPWFETQEIALQLALWGAFAVSIYLPVWWLRMVKR